MDPARTCVGCRRRDIRAALLRLVARDGAIVLDHNATLPGRGAWVHRDRDCVEAAVKRHAFQRAFKTGAGFDTSVFATLWIEPDPSDRTG